MKTLTIKTSILLIIILLPFYGGTQSVYKDQFAHTFSIVARDKVTGEMAVAVQSHWFSVGTLVSWGKSGVGVIATQSFLNPAFGPNGLKLLSEGKNATEAVNLLINGDEGRDFRQLAILDAQGNVATYTGGKSLESANHIIGDNFSVQANMMLNDKVVPAMAKAFEENSNLPLEERVLKVLQAAQKAGGDIRGKQSAVLLVVKAKKEDKPWLDKKIDLRVDDHKTPILELERLLKVHQAYEHMNRGDLAIELDDMSTALEEYNSAQQMFPDNLEMKYWTAVTLANNNRLQEALPLFKTVFEANNNWRILTSRLPKSGLLEVSEADYNTIMGI
jgi:uncharacterized Ntn-hydrolase superfamily protein